MKILVNPTLFWQLVRHLANTNIAWKSASVQNFRTLFVLAEEMFTKAARDHRQFVIEDMYIFLCKIELLSNSK